MAFYIGAALLDLNIHIPYATLFITMAVVAVVVLTYPSRWSATLSKKQFYIRQKTSDYIIAASSFIMVATLVNNNMPLPGATVSLASNVTAITTPTAQEIIASLKYRDKSTLTGKEKRILMGEFKRQLKLYAVAKLKGDKDAAGQTLGIIGVILAAVGLFYVVAALACTLSCGGSDAAAVIVLVLGTALVIWGAVVAIRRISHGPRSKKKNDIPAAAAN